MAWLALSRLLRLSRDQRAPANRWEFEDVDLPGAVSSVASTPDQQPPHVPARVLVDPDTRTFWSRGALMPSTLIEIEGRAIRAPASTRVAALLAAHERGDSLDSLRPRGNPGFSEALFIELMRARQYSRAFGLLAPSCQQMWGGAAAFTAAQEGSDLERLDGVDVVAVRHLAQWRDPDLDSLHEQVAELDVEYCFNIAGRQSRVARTVHLVAVDGRWRSLCYPAAGQARRAS